MNAIIEAVGKPAVIFGLDIVGYSKLEQEDQRGYVADLWSQTYNILSEILVDIDPSNKKQVPLSSFLLSPRSFLDTGDGYYILFTYNDSPNPIIRAIVTFYLALKNALTSKFRAAIHIGEVYQGNVHIGTDVEQQLIVGKSINCTARFVDLADRDNLVVSCDVASSFGIDAGAKEFSLNVYTTDGGKRDFNFIQAEAPIKHGTLENIYHSNKIKPPAPVKKSASLKRLILQSLRKIEQELLVCLVQYSKSYPSSDVPDRINQLRQELDPRLTIFIAAEHEINGVRKSFADATPLRLTTSKKNERQDQVLVGFPGFDIDLLEGVGVCFNDRVYKDNDLKYGIHISLPFDAVSKVVKAHKSIEEWREHRYPKADNRSKLYELRKDCLGCQEYATFISKAFGNTKAKVALSPDPLKFWHRLGGSYIYLPLYLGKDIIEPLAVISIDVLESLESVISPDGPEKKKVGNSKTPCPVCGEKEIQAVCPKCEIELKTAPKAIVDAAIIAMYRRLGFELATIAGVIGEYLKI